MLIQRNNVQNVRGNNKLKMSLGRDLISLIISQYYPFDTLKELFTLRLVSKHVAETMSTPLRVNEKRQFWISVFYRMEIKSNRIPSGTWLRLHKYLKMNFSDILSKYSSMFRVLGWYGNCIHVFRYELNVHQLTNILTENNCTISVLEPFIISYSDEGTEHYYDMWTNPQIFYSDHRHYCLNNYGNLVGCLYRGTLYKTCTKLWLNHADLEYDFGILNSKRRSFILEYMQDGKQRGLIDACTRNDEREYLRNNFYEIKK